MTESDTRQRASDRTISLRSREAVESFAEFDPGGGAWLAFGPSEIEIVE